MRNDDWQEVPNLWSCIIDRPGVIKSPAVKNALKPLSRLEATAADAFHIEQRSWDASADERELRPAGRQEHVRKLLKDTPAAHGSPLRLTATPKPPLRRYKPAVVL